MKELKDIQLRSSYKVLLIGESCTDEYHFGLCKRICPEAPVPVFDFIKDDNRLGMAQNVKQNLESFGVDVDIITNNPNDIVKRRFVDLKSNHILLREDIEKEIKPFTYKDLQFQLYDAVVISDYDKGFITDKEISKVISNYTGPIFVDTKKTDISYYKNCIIKINLEEENNISKFPINSEIIVTLGKDGAKWNNKLYNAPKVDVFDVTGAGDVFLASLCYFFLQLKDIEEAIKKSIYLASKSVQHIGIYKLTHWDIREAK